MHFPVGDIGTEVGTLGEEVVVVGSTAGAVVDTPGCTVVVDTVLAEQAAVRIEAEAVVECNCCGDGRIEVEVLA